MKTTVKKQIKLSSVGYGYTIYIIDYTNFNLGIETETEAENKAFIYWDTKNGLKFQDERSKNAYYNNLIIEKIK